MFVIDKLACAKEEWQKLVVVQAPDTVTACRLEVIGALYVTHDHQVAREHDQREYRECRLVDQSQLSKAEQPQYEVQLVP